MWPLVNSEIRHFGFFRCTRLTMLVIVLCLVGAVWGQSIPPPKCCVARQFEAKMGETGGSIYSSHGVEVPALIDVSVSRNFYSLMYVCGLVRVLF